MAKIRAENASVDRVREVLDYDPATGSFLWKITRGRQPAGSVAGCVTSTGYRYIHIDGKFYRSARVAWAVINGSWPAREVDHKDRDRTNDAADNLRLASPTENRWNSSTRSDNKSGCRGVHYQRTRKRWRAHIQVDGKVVHLGEFRSKKDAIAARRAAQHHGEFAA